MLRCAGQIGRPVLFFHTPDAVTPSSGSNKPQTKLAAQGPTKLKATAAREQTTANAEAPAMATLATLISPLSFTVLCAAWQIIILIL